MLIDYSAVYLNLVNSDVKEKFEIIKKYYLHGTALKYFNCLELSIVKDISQDDIAAMMGVSQPYVALMLRSIKKKLKIIIEFITSDNIDKPFKYKDILGMSDPVLYRIFLLRLAGNSNKDMQRELKLSHKKFVSCISKMRPYISKDRAVYKFFKSCYH